MPQPNYLFDAGHNKREGFTKPETNDEIVNALFLAEYETLKTDNKTIGGAINELKTKFANYYTSLEVDNAIIKSLSIDEYEALNTQNQTIIGAINEINSKFGNYYTKQEIDVMIENIYPTNTAAGAVANFKTALSYPLQSLTANIKATQAAGTPTPATPLPISGWSAVNIVHCKKNILNYDENKVDVGTTTTSTTRAFYPLGFKNITLTFSAKLKEGASTTTSDYLNIGKIRKSDGLLEILNSFVTPSDIITRTVTLSGDDTVILMSLENPTVIKSIMSRYDIQVEVGSIATTYEAYNGNNIIISLGGNYYGGYITQAKNGARNLILTHKMLDWSNLTFKRSNNGDNWANYLFYASVSDMKYNYLQKSDIYEIQSTGNVGDIGNYKFRTSFSGAVPYVYFRNDDYIDVDAFVEAMNDHQFLYEITEPITISLTDGDVLYPLNGINNIFADSGDVSVDFKQDVANYVQSLIGG